MKLEEIEYYHNAGKMPNWIYYQLNRKSSQQNYLEQRKNIFDRVSISNSIEVLENQLGNYIGINLEQLLSNIIQNININI